VTLIPAKRVHLVERKQVDPTTPRPRHDLQPDTILKRAENVRLLLTGAETIKVLLPSGTLDCGYVGFRLLERFGRPARVRDIVDGDARSTQEWMDLLNTVAGLVEHGVLYDVSKGPGSVEVRGYGFDNPRPHIEMLDDVVRTRGFIRAVESAVRPGDVVVEVGTGTGVLAMAAARAGAERVYAIEAGAIADLAEENVAANGFADVIRVLRGWSTTLELPQRADVLITETIGSDPLDERIVEIVLDARRRLLRPGARIVPTRLAVFGTAVEVPEAFVAGFVHTVGRTKTWQGAYGFDLSPLVPAERRLQGYRVPMSLTRQWPRLSAPARLFEVDLRTVTSNTVVAEARASADEPGRLDGALLHFVAEVAPGLTLSTDPQAADVANSWSNVLSLCPAMPIQRGRTLRFSYRWNAGAGEAGLVVEPEGEASGSERR
jgi:precorrin-6B methylase 2